MVSGLAANSGISSPFGISIQVDDLILPTDLAHRLDPRVFGWVRGGRLGKGKKGK